MLDTLNFLQSLHLLSACSFLVTYALIPFHPAVAAILGWVVAMCIRRVGDFFLEPRRYDHINDAGSERKKDIKHGANLRPTAILLSIWAALSFVLWLQPTLFGILAPWVDPASYVVRVGVAWIGLGVGLAFARSAWPSITHGAQTRVAVAQLGSALHSR